MLDKQFGISSLSLVKTVLTVLYSLKRIFKIWNVRGFCALIVSHLLFFVIYDMIYDHSNGLCSSFYLNIKRAQMLCLSHNADGLLTSP